MPVTTLIATRRNCQGPCRMLFCNPASMNTLLNIACVVNGHDASTVNRGYKGNIAHSITHNHPVPALRQATTTGRSYAFDCLAPASEDLRDCRCSSARPT